MIYGGERLIWLWVKFMNDKQQEANDQILLIYMRSGLSMDEIIESLKRLLSTAKISQERVDDE